MIKSYPILKKIVPIFFLLFSIVAFSQTQTFTTSGSIAVPVGVTQVTVEVWGAGGGGGGSYGKSYSAGGGGGGGYTHAIVDGLVSGQMINYTVGIGGSFNIVDGNGETGGTTAFLSVAAIGGSGGGGSNDSPGVFGAGGAGGIGGTTNGGAGFRGQNNTSNAYGGGGGSSAGTGSDGNPAINQDGASAVTDGGAGGNGADKNKSASPVTSIGGGGGGAGDVKGTKWYAGGGKGGNGQIRITWTYMDFIGTTNNDYVYFGNNHNFLATAPFSLEAWVLQTNDKMGTHTIISKGDAKTGNLRGYHLFLYDGKPTFNWYNNLGVPLSTISSPNAINDGKWHHISLTYNGLIEKLYVDGLDVVPAGVAFTSIATGTQPFLIGAMYDSSPATMPKNNFDGYIDEVRVWGVALTEQQIREMMNQRIIQNGTTVRGKTIPLDVTGGLLWANLKGYYPMNDGPTASDKSNNGKHGLIKNMVTIQPNTAPLPYESILGGDWDVATTWKNNTVQYLPYSVGIDGLTKIEWNIVETNHNIFTTHDITVFGLKNNVNKLSVNASSSLEVLYYLLINEKIDLIGESQLIQSKESIFDANSLGVIEIDQQGEGNKYRYNYWSMPVYTANDGTNYTTIFASLRDGTNPGSPAPITFSNSGYDGAQTTPITLSTYWMFKYANSGNGYSAWNQVRSTGKVYTGQGFTMKGPKNPVLPVTPEQNYVFVGKPNNGNINLTVAKEYDYLVGNPYPSAIDADQFLSDNSPSGTASITGTIYFWEHYGGNTHNLAGYQGGYATYSLGGEAPASSFPGLGGGISVKGVPGRFIPVGQAFFVVGDDVDGGQIQFNNGQRVFEKEFPGNSIFMKSSNTKAKIENTRLADLRPKFRIGFDAPKISHRQILFTIDERATQAVDWGFDAEIYEIFADDMYWILNNKRYVIQATNNVGLNSEVPIGIQLSKTGMVTVKIDALENVDDDTTIYLKDKVTGESFNMREKPVQLNLVAGKYADRFVLVFKTQKLMAEDVKAEILIPAAAQPIIEGIHVFMNKAKGELQIKNNSIEEITSVALVNSVGQTIKTWNSNFNIRTISLPISTATGVYFVQITTKSGNTVKKISVE